MERYIVINTKNVYNYIFLLSKTLIQKGDKQKMKYSELLPQVFVTSVAGVVPYIEGHAGVGKSQMIKEVAKLYKENGFDDVPVVTLFGALLKEGELGGIPVPRKDDESGRMVNDYTTHVKLNQILENDKKGINTILFIDELNRCENAVNQELMQLILDRRINETILPEGCIVIAAGNPEYDDDNDYQVNVMNDAMKNRFVKYTLEADVKDWLKWASNTKDDPETGSEAIDTDIIEFIAEMPNLLHDPHSKEEVKPTPRGWELLSKVMRQIKTYYPENFEGMLFEAAKGVVGQTPATSLTSFLRNKKNPITTVKEIFQSTDEKFERDILSKIKGDTSTRQFVIIDRCIRYIDENLKDFNDKKTGDKLCKRFIEVCRVLPKDIMVGVLKNIGVNYKKIHDTFTKYDDYMDLFFDTNKKTMAASNI